tara:strand:+ start:67 stop:816 length:750 start_codon:yes stop_codon:yes gene_type:complete
MTRKIHIIIFFLIQVCLGQNIDPVFNIQEEIEVNKVINSYIKAIGGEKRIKEVRTLQKKVNIEIYKSNSVDMNATILYKQPNLYSHTLNISELGNIQSTKYDGLNCVLKRNYNNNNISETIEGELLEEKKDEFYPFPIIALKNSNKLFKSIELQKNSNENICIIKLIDFNELETNLFFDETNKLLSMKQTIRKNVVKTIKYKDYDEFDGIIFPFTELHIMEINGKVVQESINQINEIVINEDIMIDQFQ